MRQSIGTVSVLNFVIVFIFIIFAFLMGTFSYYKAYKVNNYLVAAIEKYEGFNALSAAEIKDKLDSMGYEIRDDMTCPSKVGTSSGHEAFLVNPGSVSPIDNDAMTYHGYCVYMVKNDTIYNKHGGGGKAETDQYDTYEVTTYITFNAPFFEKFIKLRVTSKTGRIFYFN